MNVKGGDAAIRSEQSSIVTIPICQQSGAYRLEIERQMLSDMRQIKIA
jgi:hypothetical protein